MPGVGHCLHVIEKTEIYLISTPSNMAANRTLAAHPGIERVVPKNEKARVGKGEDITEVETETERGRKKRKREREGGRNERERKRGGRKEK